MLTPSVTDLDELNLYLTFTNSDRHFCVEVTRVLEIRRWTKSANAPIEPRYALGVRSARGEIVPVHDLRMRLGGQVAKPTETHVILIVSIADETLGLMVDAVEDMAPILSSEIEAAPSTPDAGNDDAIVGLINLGDRTVSLVDLDRLFDADTGKAAIAA